MSEPTTQSRTTRPALDVLDRDQDRLLYTGDTRRDPPIEPLADGFSTYWSVLTWYQAAGIRTLGHVEAVLEPSDIMPLSSILEYLFATEDAPEGRYVRMRIVESLSDGCDLAYKQFRERANERVENEEGSTWKEVDPDSERNPLMRPAFRRLDRSQAGALIELWDGFEDRESIGRWVRSLAAPTNGETPEGFLTEIVSSPPLLDALLDTESRAAKMTRYRFAVGALLPPFLSAARTLNGGERTDSSGKTHGAWNS
ncbi:hypothetical protein [Halorubrum cibi]|uniref:Uncharacterized protein n=1 Tax=Halorubrum cibi TaxID=413815 RepID=A0A521F736_9EURY|nr:hypothetical protein [Halorubrum cibi]SMO91904.1 hypothetical protein SAMN06264867_1222 [Halorubrum cibi]